MKLVYKVLIGVGVGVIVITSIGVGTVYGIWGKELNSISSIREIIPEHPQNRAGKVYEMTMDGDYYFDEFISQGGVSNDNELIQFIIDNITKGIIPIVNIYYFLKGLRISPWLLMVLALGLILLPDRLFILTIICVFAPFIIADTYGHGKKTGFLGLILPFIIYPWLAYLSGNYIYKEES